MNFIPKQKNRGVTLLEAVIYVLLFTILFALLVNVMLSLAKSYVEVQRFRAITTNASVVMERISREVRDSSSVDISLSTLETSPGELYLNSNHAGGGAKTVRFYLNASSTIFVEVDGDGGSQLSGNTVDITDLTFRHIVSSSSEAVRIELEIQNREGKRTLSERFYDTIVLRRSYAQ